MAASEASLEHSIRYLQSSNSCIVAAMGALSFCAAMLWVRHSEDCPTACRKHRLRHDPNRYTDLHRMLQVRSALCVSRSMLHNASHLAI